MSMLNKWNDFSKVNVIDDVIQSDFEHFNVGDSVFDVWSWFESKNFDVVLGRDFINYEYLDKWISENNIQLNKINSGSCENFAMDVVKDLFPQGQVVGTDNFCDWWGDSPDSNLPGHCWIELNGFHYDCYSLDGVSNWRDLKIFKNKA